KPIGGRSAGQRPSPPRRSRRFWGRPSWDASPFGVWAIETGAPCRSSSQSWWSWPARRWFSGGSCRTCVEVTAMRRARDFLRDLRREHPHMLGGSMWLLAGTLAVSLGSFVFWLLVARNVDSSDVGRATALFSATTFVCYLISLGLPVAISRHASD